MAFSKKRSILLEKEIINHLIHDKKQAEYMKEVQKMQLQDVNLKKQQDKKRIFKEIKRKEFEEKQKKKKRMKKEGKEMHRII